MSERPNPEIPLIDVSGIIGQASDGEVERVARQISEAARGTGFFYVKGHGVPAGTVDAALAANRRFHALPLDEKMKVRRNAWHRGYSPVGVSTLKSSARFESAKHPNQLESVSIRHEVPSSHPDYERQPLQGPNPWPDDHPWFRQAIQPYDSAMHELAMKLLHPVAVAVGEQRQFFDPYFTPATSNLRVIHYPPAPPRRPEDLFGIHPHTDYGFLTILAQDDVGGLQVQRVDGTWIDAVYMPGTFIINVGDVLARWTNDTFNSTPHRVISPAESRDRYSIGYFFDPRLDAEISCLPRFQEAAPPKYDPIRYGDYFAMRLDANHPNRTPGGKPTELAAY